MKARKANLKDLNQLSDLFDRYRQFYQQAADLKGAKEFISKRLENQQSVIFVVESDDKLLGFTQLFPSFSSVSMQRLWVLNDLFVAVAARQQGVAQSLMEAAKHFAQETNSKGLTLETDLDNIAAQKLYDGLGYQRQADTYHYFLANE
ncbi:acetyltransferase, GNAT family [hydrothermal vent metagenome]|uniref:Acetyltransferase, GNAT family n=1 Tax=hydrothermal vent metagenome TaxID=652676 RepID=A0A3B0VL38_9ZZZZ